MEQALPDSACVVHKVCTAVYPVSFEDVWGTDACDIAWPADVNAENPFYNTHPDYVDKGLGGFLESAGYDEDTWEANLGKHKVPTVRNVGKGLPGLLKAYGHNGYFKSLEAIVHFYNTRDVKPVCPGDYTEAQALAAGCWPAPEVMESSPS